MFSQRAKTERPLTASVAATTAATTITATAATTAATTTTAAATFFAGPSFVDRQPATIMFLLVERLNRCPSGVVVRHFHESKTLAATRIAVLDYLSTTDFTKRSEQLLQAGVGRLVAQVADIQFLTHD
jgi:hypothetical protein